jgi:CHASE2 domain-containing sensor protein
MRVRLSWSRWQRQARLAARRCFGATGPRKQTSAQKGRGLSLFRVNHLRRCVQILDDARLRLPVDTMNPSFRWRLAMGGVVAVALVAISASARLFEPWEMWWLDQVLRARLEWGLTPDVDRRIILLTLGVEDEKVDGKEAYDDAAAIIQEAAACGAAVVAFDFVFLRGTEQTAKKLQETIAAVRDENQCAVVLGEVLGGGLRRSFSFADRHQPAGFIDVSEGSGCVFRRYQMVYRNGALLEPSFALATYLAWLRVDWPQDIQFDRAGEVQWSETEGGARSASDVPVLLNFRAP